MLDIIRKPTPAKWSICIAILALVSPAFVPRTVLPLGFNVFFSWAVLCAAAVFADRMIVWAILSGTGLLAVSFDWWIYGPPPINEYGFGAIDAIALFTGTTLVVAGTGVMGVVLTTMRHRQRDVRP